ncbi:efflux RND transporter periplasmic adaptor subunit [Plantactinospora solaniradicis]|uniref:Efflux RND transporter periplasmic adaptor subunit n=1 Tax=Plantactinospora solaniradicis TaxID=1723736 RepID=A0ABW1K0Z6_9ACTN
MRIRWWVAAGALLAVAGVVGWAVTRAPSAEPVAGPQVRTTTAPLTRGDVTARVQVAGVLGFDRAYTVVNRLPGGVVTAVSAPGTQVARGAELYAVAGVPAVLMYGTTPAYRDFAAGMTDGADVRQLEQNLVGLGLDPRRRITVDRHFSGATASAIRRWKAARGVPVAQRTGRLAFGQVVFLPGPVRVGQAVVEVGGSAVPGAPVLAATATARVVRVALTADRQPTVHPGDPVRVTVPGLAEAVSGTVREIGTVATAPSQGPGPATVPMVVTVTLPAGAPALDQAPVQVSVTGAQRRNVLLVPVTALLAGASGGYQVAVADDAGRRLVPVRPGLFDEAAGTVEVTGDGLAEGTPVEVPVS